MKNLLDMDEKEIEYFLIQNNYEKFRAKQIFKWLYRGVFSIDEMTDLSKSLRDELKKYFYIHKLEVLEKFVSEIDNTKKYLFKLEDNNVLESVLMDYKHGLSACISSQVGCKMGCNFCASSKLGFVRNLSPGEIIEQILAIQHDENKKIGNIVLMGIGEPLDNYDNVIKFLKLVNHPSGLNVGYRHISLSTCGVVPGILNLADNKMPITLSISIHAPNDEIRQKIMPINKKYPIDQLIHACKVYVEKTKRRITFEYALIRGVNDGKNHAHELAKKIKGLLCHVNLIPINLIKGDLYERSSLENIKDFKKVLEYYNINVTIRRELGSDINAACGQLRRSFQEKLY